MAETGWKKGYESRSRGFLILDVNRSRRDDESFRYFFTDQEGRTIIMEQLELEAEFTDEDQSEIGMRVS
jgi:hypothetical protein